MSLPITFHGGAGDQKTSELGGVQAQIGSLLVDIGQPPDRNNEIFDFPQNVRWYNAIDSLDNLGFLPAKLGIARKDFPVRHAKTEGDHTKVTGILETHWHLDHIAYAAFVDPSITLYMHWMAKQGLYAWQYTSQPNINQWVDFYAKGMKLPGKHGDRIVMGEQARVLRSDFVFEDYQTFEHDGMKITAYPVDHSLPGSCGFMIEADGYKIAISGDFRNRGRRPKHTQKFVEATKEADIFFLEGSLLHFDHYGTEHDVEKIMTQTIANAEFTALAYPPRDLDRIQSVANAAKANGKMLVIPTNQAALLEMFNGIYDYPKLDHKYIGVLKPPKVTGNLDDRDYSFWENDLFGRMKPWNEEDGHQGRPQYVTLEQIANNLEEFVIFIGAGHMEMYLERITKGQPLRDGQFIRLHPAPWNTDMREQEKQHIRLQQIAGIYKGKSLDALDVLHTQDLFADPNFKPKKVKMPTVHVTGHHNREETKATIDSLPENVVIGWYHGMNSKDIEEISGNHPLFIPERGKTYELEEIINGTR